MKATVDLGLLEDALTALYEQVKAQIAEVSASNDPHAGFRLSVSIVRMEAMGSLLTAFACSLEGDDARKRFRSMQRRFEGYHGAAVTAAESNLQRLKKQRAMI